MECTVESSVKPIRLSKALNESEIGFKVRFHDYVSSDPSVSVTGTQLPRPTIPKILAEQSIGEILAASAAALRVKTSEIKKKGPLRPLFVHLASLYGWHRPLFLSQICGVIPRSIYFILSHDPPTGIAAAELCLGDQRLRAKDSLCKI